MTTLHPACHALRIRILSGDGLSITKQEIFDAVAQHIFHQGVRSVSLDTTVCLYRGQDSTCCAVGALIPDLVYIPFFEKDGRILKVRDSLRRMDNYAAQDVADFLNENNHFLQNLQIAHDRPSHWDTTTAMRNALIDEAYNVVDTSIVNSLSFGDR